MICLEKSAHCTKNKEKNLEELEQTSCPAVREPPAAQGARETILDCRDLFKSYGQTVALQNVDLKVRAGGIVGLLGPNGSGKSTLIKLAMGMLQPTVGEILIAGKRPCSATKAMTAYLPDVNFLPDWMRVEQALRYIADFFPDFRRDRAEMMLSRLGIGLKQRIKALSKGNKEKVGLIVTMARDAKLYILDEPIAGVDPAARDFILDIIFSQKPEEATILLCTHLIADIEPILTHAVFLANGRIVSVHLANWLDILVVLLIDAGCFLLVRYILSHRAILIV